MRFLCDRVGSCFYIAMADQFTFYANAPPDVESNAWANIRAADDNILETGGGSAKVWEVHELDRLIADARRVAKYAYIFSELLPTLHGVSADRTLNRAWPFIWGSLMRADSVKMCTVKWNAAMQTVGDRLAYLPGPVLDIRVEDVPTQILELISPPANTDCDDAFIAGRAAMFTGAMFRALTKLLWGETWIADPAQKTRQRFPIPLVQTKWSKSFATGSASTTSSLSFVQHSVIDKEKVKTGAGAGIVTREARCHGRINGTDWHIYSHSNYVWLQSGKAENAPAFSQTDLVQQYNRLPGTDGRGHGDHGDSTSDDESDSGHPPRHRRRRVTSTATPDPISARALGLLEVGITVARSVAHPTTVTLIIIDRF